MKQATKYIFTVVSTLVAFFIVVKICFLCCNYHICPFSMADVPAIFLHGLFLDISMAVVIAVPTWIVTAIAVLFPRTPLRAILAPWYMVLTFCMAFIYWGDIILYGAWGFKLNYAIFSYISSPGEGTASMTWWHIVSRVLLILGTMLVLGGGGMMATPRRLHVTGKRLARVRYILVASAVLGLLASAQWLAPAALSRGYYSDCLLRNHATQNPLYTLGISSIMSNRPFRRQFQTLSPQERERYFEGLYPCTDGLTDTLLTHPDPNVLVIQLESQSSIFTEELGGISGVTPNQSRLMGEGILFSRVYANSFRTDRGTVSAFSGYVSFPSTSLMLQKDIRTGLPSLATSMARAGYSTEYIYGGNLSGMEANEYLAATGYTRQTDMYALAPKGASIVSAAPDSLSAQYVFETIRKKPLDEKWHIVYQTITSHEPFNAPTRILPNDTLNAFAYTDAAIGRLADSLRTIPEVWDNLLIVIIPDHGCMFRRSYEDNDYFHIPMIWCGGAVRNPGTCVDIIMNQSDMAATLLAQLEIPHDDYPWSRNVLSPGYRHPSAYSTWPSGFVFVDESGVSSYDIYGSYVIGEYPADEGHERLKRGHAILQTSYLYLDSIANSGGSACCQRQ